MDLLNQENPKPNKAKKMILILLVTSVIALVITLILILYLSKTKFSVSRKNKIFIDGQQNSTIQIEQILLKTGEENNYVSIKELATLIGCNYFNGEYLKYTEDKTKCYVESIAYAQEEQKLDTEKLSNIVGLEADSNLIYKTNSKSGLDYEYIEITKPVLKDNDNLYISLEDAQIALGTYINYSEESGLEIYTLHYLTEFYNKKVTEKGYNSINIENNNYNTIAYNLLLVNKNEKYGIIDLEFNEIVGTKYDDIKFNESTKEFIVSNDNKYGIIDKNGNTKVNLIYDEISIINHSPLLYKVKSNGKYGIVNGSGILITDIEYEEIGCVSDLENVSDQTTVVIPKLSEEINQSIVVKKDTGYGLVDAETGLLIIECTLEQIYNVIKDGQTIYEAVFRGYNVDLIQYIKAVNTIVVNM